MDYDAMSREELVQKIESLFAICEELAETNRELEAQLNASIPF